MSACFIVSVPDPTLVPKEFATSLPPMLNAMKTPKTIAVISSTRFVSGATHPSDHSTKLTNETASRPPNATCHQTSPCWREPAASD